MRFRIIKAKFGGDGDYFRCGGKAYLAFTKKEFIEKLLTYRQVYPLSCLIKSRYKNSGEGGVAAAALLLKSDGGQFHSK